MKVIKIKLPNDLITNLSQCENVVFNKCHSEEDISVIQLNQSKSAMKIFLEYLQTDETLYGKHGPMLMVHFGHPINPYVDTLTQAEVFNLLNTYNNFELGSIPSSFTGNFQYNSNKSIYSILMDIQKTTHDEYPLLQNLQSGAAICDMSITYSNIVVTLRINAI